jgi:hypothetical protein
MLELNERIAIGCEYGMEVGQEFQVWCRFRGTFWILVVARDSADSPREGLGATVLSFDFDRSRLHERRNSCIYFPSYSAWRAEEKSARYSGYLDSLGEFDVVYCSAVLHDTRAMWLGIASAIQLR